MDQKDLPLLVDRVERCPETQDDYRRLNGADSPALETISRSVLICGDAVHALTLLPNKSIQTVVTSPPYWSLRDYDVKDQIG
jgi:site-specific DNA-methyltransferase (adenine-specific)